MSSITLDKNDPEIAAALGGCKVGDTYTMTVTEDSGDMVTMSVESESAEVAEPADEPAPAMPMKPRYSNPVVAKVA